MSITLPTNPPFFSGTLAEGELNSETIAQVTKNQDLHVKYFLKKGNSPAKTLDEVLGQMCEARHTLSSEWPTRTKLTRHTLPDVKL